MTTTVNDASTIADYASVALHGSQTQAWPVERHATAGTAPGPRFVTQASGLLVEEHDFYLDGVVETVALPAMESPDPAAYLATDTELVTQVLDGYSLTKTELGQLVGVSRQSVHAWLRGSSELSTENQSILREMRVLLSDLTLVGVARPSAYILCPVFDGAATAADLIRTCRWERMRDFPILMDRARPRTSAGDPEVATPALIERVGRMGRLLSRAD